MDEFADILPKVLLVGVTLFILTRFSGIVGAGAKGMFGEMSSIVRNIKPGEIKVKFRYVVY